MQVEQNRAEKGWSVFHDGVLKLWNCPCIVLSSRCPLLQFLENMLKAWMRLHSVFHKKGQSWTLTMALTIQTVSSEAVSVQNTFYSISIHICAMKFDWSLVQLNFFISFIKTSALKWMDKHLNTQYFHFFQ